MSESGKRGSRGSAETPGSHHAISSRRRLRPHPRSRRDRRGGGGRAATAPLAGRAAAVERARRHLSTRDVWPFTRETATGNGFIQTCLHWPSTPPGSEPKNLKLPAVPTLLINGDHDLSTPLEWAVEEVGYAPNGKLVVIKGASHSIQNRELGTTGRQAVYAFLND
jgi:pimeloyl-ACP methyl ester carboxylesterase